jgi:predicted RNase H-like HicB family nuclease
MPIQEVVMILQYIRAAMEKARYEIIDDEEPYYGEIPDCKGVWATGKTLEECRRNLAEVLDGWIVVRLQRGLPLPPIEGFIIEPLEELKVYA